ncbi:hypothetical protein Plhal304r1_c022g0078101 [Plasmopara halstedii]
MTLKPCTHLVAVVYATPRLRRESDGHSHVTPLQKGSAPARRTIQSHNLDIFWERVGVVSRQDS